MKKIKEFFDKLFCKHDWYKTHWEFAEDHDTIYSKRYYKCVKCGKTICVDGRFDTKGNRDIKDYIPN